MGRYRARERKGGPPAVWCGVEVGAVQGVVFVLCFVVDGGEEGGGFAGLPWSFVALCVVEVEVDEEGACFDARAWVVGVFVVVGLEDGFGAFVESGVCFFVGVGRVGGDEYRSADVRFVAVMGEGECSSKGKAREVGGIVGRGGVDGGPPDGLRVGPDQYVGLGGERERAVGRAVVHRKPSFDVPRPTVRGPPAKRDTREPAEQGDAWSEHRSGRYDLPAKEVRHRVALREAREDEQERQDVLKRERVKRGTILWGCCD